jgi:hypothetical protein
VVDRLAVLRLLRLLSGSMLTAVRRCGRIGDVGAATGEGDDHSGE